MNFYRLLKSMAGKAGVEPAIAGDIIKIPT